MATAPYGVRLLVGAATVAVEETRKLPKTIVMYPMTLASQAAQAVMRFQQNLAELVVKGDTTLESLFPPNDEKPEWATFDEDSPTETQSPAEGERKGEGRFALYSVANAAESASESAPESAAGSAKASKPAAARRKPTQPSAQAPAIAAELDYQALTLAQLRARLHTLDISDLEALLAFEQASKARAPFETLLANRITRANAK